MAMSTRGHRGRRESARRAGRAPCVLARGGPRGRRGDCRQRGDGSRRADDERHRRRSLRHRPRRRQRTPCTASTPAAGRRPGMSIEFLTARGHEHDAAAGHSCRDGARRRVRAGWRCTRRFGRAPLEHRSCRAAIAHAEERIPRLGDHVARVAGQRAAAAAPTPTRCATSSRRMAAAGRRARSSATRTSPASLARHRRRRRRRRSIAATSRRRILACSSDRGGAAYRRRICPNTAPSG